MAKLVTRNMRIGNRSFRLRGEIPIRAILREANVVVKARMRVIMEEAKLLIVDRLFAAPATPPATATLLKPDLYGPGSEMRIDRHAFGHVPLKYDTAVKKYQAGKDGRPLIATGSYVYGIEFGEEETQWGTRYYVRPTSGGSEDLTPRQLAQIHEYGSASRNIPARPHWGPAMRQVAAEVRVLGKDVRAAMVRTALRSIR